METQVGGAHFDRWGPLAVATLLGLAFVTGGGSSGRGTGEIISQLLALPLAVWAASRLSDGPGAPLRVAAMAVACLLVATLAIQLLPLPDGVWRSIVVRDALAADLRAGGVEHVRTTWSLAPLATERALWSTLPALAVFLGALAIPTRRHRWILAVVVLLTAASLVLGVVQLGLPQDSVLNLFPRWAPALNGVFANPNHQGMALAVSVVMVAALLVSDWTCGHAGRSSPRRRLALLLLAGVMLVSIPLTGSRAAFLLVLMGLLAVPVMFRAELGRMDVFQSRTPALKWLPGLLVLGAVLASLAWVRFEASDSIRWSLASTTAAMGWAHFPLGAGTGTFVPWFDQVAPVALVQWEYFNHAHNEYVQWWFEAGVLGMLCVLGVIAVLAACYPCARRATGPGADRGVAVAAWLGCVLLLSHAWVEYLLRTQALMTVAALLAGLAVARQVEASCTTPNVDAG